MQFRPCIDLHQGKVKQIVGSTLKQGEEDQVKVNFTSEKSPAHYATMYREDQLTGGHIIMLGPGNLEAAREALHAWPGGMQVGGGITIENAQEWLDEGASHVIVTSWVFANGLLERERLQALSDKIGKNRLVLDLSCRYKDDAYYVVTDRWQKFTDLQVRSEVLDDLACYCDEFLVHAVDVEGKSMGIDEQLVDILAKNSPVPITYAGGISTMDDIERIHTAGKGAIDITVGSALDIFGGNGIKYSELLSMLQNGRFKQ